MVAVMVEQFREMQLRLADTIEHCDTLEFRLLDTRIAHVFDAICQHEPRDADEVNTMARLFLDLIEENDDGNSTHLIERIRTILRVPAGRFVPPMEIVYGAGI